MYNIIVTSTQQQQQQQQKKQNRKLVTQRVEAAAAKTDSWSLEAHPSGSIYGQSLVYLPSSRPANAT